MLEDLGEDFGVFHVVFKPYPANISHQSPIGLLAQLVQVHDIKAANVKRIDLGVRETTLLHGGAIYEPQDAIGAQFSLAFSLAIRVVKRSNDLRLYTDPTLWRDREVLRLAKKVHLHPDPRFVGTKGRGCHMKVSLTDGRVFEVEEEYHKGMPQNPFTPAQLTNKFRTSASSVLSEERREAVINTVSRLDVLEDMGELTSLLAPEQHEK
jgi:2-methylcitrate dehydratase PrpD